MPAQNKSVAQGGGKPAAFVGVCHQEFGPFYQLRGRPEITDRVIVGTEEFTMVGKLLSQNTASDCCRLEAAHGMTISIGTSAHAQANACCGGGRPNGVLIGNPPPIGPGLCVPTPIAAEKRDVEARIDQDADERKPIAVAAPDKKYIARRRRWRVYRPWPVHVGIVCKRKIFHDANAGAEEVPNICPTRRENCVICR